MTSSIHDHPVPEEVFFFPGGSAFVIDERGNQMTKYHCRDHDECVRRLQVDGYDWRKLKCHLEPELQRRPPVRTGRDDLGAEV